MEFTARLTATSSKAEMATKDKVTQRCSFWQSGMFRKMSGISANRHFPRQIHSSEHGKLVILELIILLHEAPTLATGNIYCQNGGRSNSFWPFFVVKKVPDSRVTVLRLHTLNYVCFLALFQENWCYNTSPRIHDDEQYFGHCYVRNNNLKG